MSIEAQEFDGSLTTTTTMLGELKDLLRRFVGDSDHPPPGPVSDDEIEGMSAPTSSPPDEERRVEG